MRRDWGNAFILSSKKAGCRLRGDPGREVRKLQGALEAERRKAEKQQAAFAAELWRLREAAEAERRQAVRDVTSRLEQQRLQDLRRLRDTLARERDAEIRQLLGQKDQELRAVGSGLEKEREVAVRHARQLQRQLARQLTGRHAAGAGERGCPGGLAAYRRLEQLLNRLVRATDGEQAALARRVTRELQLHKGYFLCHLLDADGLASPGRGRGRRRALSCIPLLDWPAEGVEEPTSVSKSPRSASPASERTLWSLPPGSELSKASRCSSPLRGASHGASSAESPHRSTASQPSVMESSPPGCSPADVGSMVSALTPRGGDDDEYDVVSCGTRVAG